MKTITLSILIILFSIQGFSQQKTVSLLNDSTELHQFADGQSLKVRYLLNGTAISLKEKEDILAGENYVHQEFNIKTVGKELWGEINLLADIVIVKKPDPRPVILPPNSINIFSKLDSVFFPDFLWKDLEGNSYTPDKLKGNVVVFNFWHTTCGPCIAEMPMLNELAKQYVGKQVTFISSTPNDESQVKKFLQKNKFDYKQVVSVDPQGIFDPFPGWPIHIVVDKNGLIRLHELGKQPDIVQKLVKTIDASLAQSK